MARYWIRNRGRVQGPFSEERIQGLLRRGRFSRHFHVSEDRKNWYPASDFPELFAGAGGPEPVDDDSPFQSGGSPFDDDEDEDDAPPARLPASARRRPAPRRAVAADDDDDEEDEDEDEWDDDDGNAGVLTGFVNWVEANVKVVVVVLVLILGGLSWFVFMREDFTQDTADYEMLVTVQSKVMQASQSGAQADEWIAMLEATEKELAPMVTRLEKSASAMDLVKQELLFLARDDIPRMFKELPQGKQEAANLARIRFSLIDEMITSQTRFHDGSKLNQQLTPQTPPAQNPPAENGMNSDGGQSGQSQPNQSQPNQSQPNQSQPNQSQPNQGQGPGVTPGV